MRQVRIHGRDDVRVDDVVHPEPGPRDALVDVAACGICGSDVSYVHQGGLIGPGGEPMALGHEMAGTVSWVGAEVTTVSVGDRVVVHPGDDDLGRIGNGAAEGGLTPSLVVREAARAGRLHRVPDGMSLEVAALAEPLAVGMRAAERSGATVGQTAAVFGCGPVGLFTIVGLLERGVRDVVAVDLSTRRRELALELGAVAACDPSTDDPWSLLAEVHGTRPHMFGPTPATDHYVEATGSAEVLTGLVERAGVGAAITVVAVHFRPIPTNFTLVLMKELSIHGSMEYPDRFEDALDLLARRDLSAVITHRVPLERFGDAFELAAGSKDCGKVLITMGPER